MNIVPLPEGWRGRALIVSDVANAEAWFDSVPSFPRGKRRQEWMLSRIAEKELRRQGTTGECVSFSHSGKYGAAAVDVRPIGIDVEMLRQLSESAAHLFLNDDESDAMRRCRIPHRLLHFWSAKEAEWKRLGGSLPTLKKVRVRFESEGANGLRFQGVETFAIDDLVAALTLSTS